MDSLNFLEHFIGKCFHVEQHFLFPWMNSFQVAKIDLNYSKTAKRLDVRKLKTSMWSVLTSSSKNLKVRCKDAC